MGRAIAAVTVAALLIGSRVAPAHPPSNSGSVARATVWIAAWTESRQRPSASFAPNWSEQGFADQTVRQVVRVSVGGVATRVRLSNAYGSAPLKVAGATIARTTGGATVQQSSLQNLTVHHARAFTVPAGAALSTDLVPMRLSALESVTITLYLAASTGPATYHASALATSYRAAGDHLVDPRAAAFTERSQSWYYVSGMDVVGTASRRPAVVALMFTRFSVRDPGSGGAWAGDFAVVSHLAGRLSPRRRWRSIRGAARTSSMR